MTFARWTGSAWNSFTTYRRWTGSAWQAIAQARRWNGTSWVTFGFLSASLSPTNVSGSRTTPGTAVSGSCTATPVNGVGPFTFLWQVTTTIGNTISAVSPTSATTIFSSPVSGTVTDCDGSAYCTITDTATGLVVNTTNTVSIALSYTGP